METEAKDHDSQEGKAGSVGGGLRGELLVHPRPLVKSGSGEYAKCFTGASTHGQMEQGVSMHGQTE